MIAAAIGLVLLCATPLLVLPRFFGPDEAVRSYFDALIDRNADKARTLLASGSAVGQSGPIGGVAERADLSLLTNETLRSRGYTPPRDVRLETTRSTHGSVTVEASYDFGGPRFEATLPMIRDRGAGRLGSWRIADGLLLLPLSATATDRLVVAGTTLPMPSGTSRVLVAFPGAYRVTIADHPLMAAQPATAFAGSTNVVMPPIEVRPEVRRDVEQQIRAHIDTCARSTELAPPGCPFVAPSWPVSNVSWQITRYPELALKVTAAGTVSVENRASGIAVMTATRLSGAGSLQESVTFEVRGTVRVVDGKALFVIER